MTISDEPGFAAIVRAYQRASFRKWIAKQKGIIMASQSDHDPISDEPGFAAIVREAWERRPLVHVDEIPDLAVARHFVAAGIAAERRRCELRRRMRES
jgi:hypothetical protein